MRFRLLLTSFVGLLCALSQSAVGQEFYLPLSGLPAPSVFRSASGLPGGEYYEQRSDYVIDVSLDVERSVIVGSQLVTYHNHSPDTHRFLWMRLPGQPQGSLTFVDALVDAKGQELESTRYGTSLRIDLPVPLEPGEQLSFAVDFTVPVRPSAPDSEFFVAANFHPRMVPYTDIGGWQHGSPAGSGTTPDAGDFLVRITAPSHYLVVAPGELSNVRQVLTPRQAEQLAEAPGTPEPVLILPLHDRRPERVTTWVYAAESAREFVFAASPDLVWEAFGIESGSQTVLANVFSTAQAAGQTEAVRNALAATMEELSRITYDYPYAHVNLILAGDSTHSYPMVHIIGELFDDQAQGRMRMEMARAFLPAFLDRDTGDSIAAFVRGYAATTDVDRLGQALGVLRAAVLGDERFDQTFAGFASRWRTRRPHIVDLARYMGNASGVHLDEFWRDWLLTRKTVDLAIDDVRRDTEDSPTLRIVLKNPGRMALPVTLRLTSMDGNQRDVVVPVETWLSQTPHLLLDHPADLAKLELDPDGRLPDTDRSNNTWPPASQFGGDSGR